MPTPNGTLLAGDLHNLMTRRDDPACHPQYLTRAEFPFGAFETFVPAERYGARPNTGADMTDEIQKAFNLCPVGATLTFRPGTYLISNTVWLSRNISVWAVGVIFDLGLNNPTTTFTGGLPPTWNAGAFLTRAAREALPTTNTAGFVWGTLGADRPERQFVKGLHVSRSVAGDSHTHRLHCGIVMLSPFECDLIETRTNNFFGGLVLASHTGQGMAYCRVVRHKDTDSRYQYNLLAQATGFANQNSFHDFRCLVSTAVRDSALFVPDAWEFCRVLMATTTTSVPNNNQFYGCVFETPNRTAGGPVGDPGAINDPVSIGRKLRLEGRDHLFANCRWEGVRRVNAANPGPLRDITIGHADLSSANFTRNVFFYGDRLNELFERDHVEYLDTSGIGLNNSNQWYTGRVNEFGSTGAGAAPAGDTNVKTTAWRFLQGSGTNAAIGICNPNVGSPQGLHEVLRIYHDPPAAVDPSGVFMGAMTWQSSADNVQRNMLGLHNASPWDLRVTEGFNIGNIFRVRPSGADALVVNPQAGGRIRTNITTGGPWEFYSTGSANNDLIRILDANEDTRMAIKANETGITAGMFSAISLYEETVAGAETLANAIVLHSTAFGGGVGAFPVGIEKGLIVNRAGGDFDSRISGDGEQNLTFWDADGRAGLGSVGFGTNSPDRLVDIQDSANPQLRLTHTSTSRFTDLFANNDGTFGGLCLLPAANAGGFFSVNIFGFNEGSGISIFDDGGDFWWRTNVARNMKYNIAAGQVYSFGIDAFGAGGGKFEIAPSLITFFVPSKYAFIAASTNVVETPLLINRQVSGAGVAADGIGAGIQWEVEDSAGTASLRSEWQVVLDDADTGTGVDASIRFKTQVAGGVPTEMMRIGGVSSSVGNVVIQHGVTSPAAATLDVRGSAIFNDPGDDWDFRVESQNVAHMIFVDANQDAVGINHSSPTAMLHVGTGTATSNLRVDGSSGTLLDFHPVDEQAIFGGTTTSMGVDVGNAFETKIGINTGFRIKRTEINSNTTLNVAHFYVDVNTGGGAVTVTLPATDDAGIKGGTIYIIKRSGGSTVTITPNGSNTTEVDSLTADDQVVWLISNGASGASGRWDAISRISP